MSETVGSKLLNEIERISAKRERWKAYARDAGPRANFAAAIFLMTAEIDAAKAALQSGEPADAIRALRNLEAYTDDD